MVSGETFAYGHIPKTGGDAVHAWLSQFPGLQVDPVNEGRKHDFFWERQVHKRIYALSIRRLPCWALSYLHELAFHPRAAQHYGIPPSDPVRPHFAQLLTPDRYLREHQKGNRRISVWLRMENLLDDLIAFIEEHIQPVTPQVRGRLQSVHTKGPARYDHNVDAFFTPEQMAALYARNPIWSAVEQQVYGSLYVHGSMLVPRDLRLRRTA